MDIEDYLPAAEIRMIIVLNDYKSDGKNDVNLSGIYH